MKISPSTGFLNVDLEIEASFPLDVLEAEMGQAVIALYCGPGKPKRFLLCLESPRWPRNPDSAAKDLCSVIERLSDKGKRLWKRAQRKEFDVGYEMAEGERAVQASLKHETLQRIVALGATVAFTCYNRAEPERISSKAKTGKGTVQK